MPVYKKNIGTGSMPPIVENLFAQRAAFRVDIEVVHGIVRAIVKGEKATVIRLIAGTAIHCKKHLRCSGHFRDKPHRAPVYFRPIAPAEYTFVEDIA